MATSKVAWASTLILVISTVCHVHSLQSNYYQHSCPGAEQTVAKVVAKAIQNDTTAGAGLLRMFFHDCFVEGCDGSVLIDSSSNDAEKNAVVNQNLHTFSVIDDAKAAVENICPQTVSCADVLAFAAVTSVAVLGGLVADIQGGRLDGFVSSANDAKNSLPSPKDSLSELQTLFSSKGLNNQDLVLLSGAHTIGKSHCASFTNRLYNGSQTNVDRSLNSDLAGSLEHQCPVDYSNSTLVNMDVQTPTHFDNAYYQNVANGKGLLTSDAQLYTGSSTSDYVNKSAAQLYTGSSTWDYGNESNAQLYNGSSTSDYVNKYAASNDDFLGDFAKALIKMGQIDVKTGSNGNIRKICSSFN